VNEVALAHVEQPLKPPIEELPDIQQKTNEAICTAMAKNPDERYQSYDQFIMELTAARSHLLIQKYGGPE
jgi:hypothetical protein